MDPSGAYPIASLESYTLELVAGDEDTDNLGHLNNGAYVAYLERGRIAFYRQVGLDIESPQAPRLGTVVVHLDINFRRECFAGDRLQVHTGILSRGNRSYTLEQSISRAVDECVCDARVTNVIMDLDSRQVVDIPSALSRLYPA